MSSDLHWEKDAADKVPNISLVLLLLSNQGVCSFRWILAVFVPSRCERFHCNAMRKAIKALMKWHTSKQKEYIPGLLVSAAVLQYVHYSNSSGCNDTLTIIVLSSMKNTSAELKINFLPNLKVKPTSKLSSDFIIGLRKLVRQKLLKSFRHRWICH